MYVNKLLISRTMTSLRNWGGDIEEIWRGPLNSEKNTLVHSIVKHILLWAFHIRGISLDPSPSDSPEFALLFNMLYGSM